jgi:protein SCO1/2
MLPQPRSARFRSPLAALAGVVAALVMMPLLAGCGGDSGAQLSAITQYQQIPDKPLPPPRASVSQSTGGSWDFQRPAAGKITLVYFGYTSCPDVCPLTMADIAGALKAVPASVRDKIAVEFVTTDPRRDTPAQLRSWLGRIDPSFVGGRAPIDTVIAAARAYGIFVKAPRIEKGNYQVTHGEQVVVLKDNGDEVGYFRELAGLKAFTKALPLLVDRYA